MRVLVTGSRRYPDNGYIASVLDHYNEVECPITCIIEGEAPTTVADLRAKRKSADIQAREWALAAGIPLLGMPAAWDFYPRNEAGPKRNGWMIQFGSPDLVLAFPTSDSIGTWDMVRKAKALDIRTVVVDDYARKDQ